MVIAVGLVGLLLALGVVGWLKGAFLSSRQILVSGSEGFTNMVAISLAALTATLRLAHPASLWARWFYGPEKFAEAQQRYLGGVT